MLLSMNWLFLVSIEMYARTRLFVAKNIHQNHGIVLLSRCFVDVDLGVHIEVHTFLFISLFDVDVLNGILS